MTIMSNPEKAAADQRVQCVRDLFRRSIELKEKLIADHAPQVVAMADVCVDALCKGGKLLLCGNGGSAADAQHLAAEIAKMAPSARGCLAVMTSINPI